MLLSLTIDNCMIYNAPVEFSMRANMHYKRFSSNVASIGKIHALKTAILIGPNNSGKTNFVRIIGMLKQLMLGQPIDLQRNMFSDDPAASLGITFLNGSEEYLFEVCCDTSKNEFTYERYARIDRDRYGNEKIVDIIVRDSINRRYSAEDPELETIMRLSARNNILIYLVDADSFPVLRKMKDIIVSFASKIDIVDMNNIPIKKTIDILKADASEQKKIADFIRNADLSLEDFRYLSDDELKIELNDMGSVYMQPQEKVLSQSAALVEMLHLASVYKGRIVPSIFYDSTGTKKIAALAGYVIDALKKGRILIIDELDNSLHFRLTRAIIALFNNELNQAAQLIATVHDTSLLDCRTLFRKEQIWFTYKDSENAYLYSLAEFTAEKDKVRDTSDLFEKYNKGIFGALPEPDLFQILLEE